MAGWPDPPFLSVEGPEFAEQVRQAESLTQELQSHNWDFELAPETWARASAACDVAAKEIVNIHDGRLQTRFGRLVMKGAGVRFNLMSHESPLSLYLGGNGHSKVFDEVNRQIGSDGLDDFPEYRELGPPQRVDLYNPTVFYQLRDVVFWNALNGFRLFPSGFEDVAKQLASGNVIRNVLFEPTLTPEDSEQPIYMQAHSAVQFPTPVVEWMPKPLYGGMSEYSFHIDTLLTVEPTSVSHPYLSLVGEGTAVLGDRRYYMRRFAGISQKDATRGPGVPPEGATT
jgi:hypothetical protein